MQEEAVTPYVFLDTQVFDAHQLDFESPNMVRIMRLASREAVKLLLTTVTKQEISGHLTKKAADTFSVVKEFRKSGRVLQSLLPLYTFEDLRKIDRNAIIKVLNESFAAFLERSKATVLPVDGVPVNEVFEKYFQEEAPFGNGNKKSEFPDAFAFLALAAWSRSNGNAKVYIVSGDGDWEAACKSEDNLIYINKLDKLVSLYAGSRPANKLLEALHANSDEVIDWAKQLIGESYIFPGHNLIEGEVDDPEVSQVEMGDARVVEDNDGVASVSVDCVLHVKAFVEADDPNSAVYDSDTKSYVHVGRIKGWIEREFGRTLEVTLEYNPKNPDLATVSRVAFSDDRFDLGVTDDELSRDYENA